MKIQRAAVVGLGTMGAGIAEVLARAGLEVIGLEADAALRDAGERRVRASLDRALDKGRLTAPDHQAVNRRLAFSTDRDDLAAADLVVEAVPEQLDLKLALFTALEAHCSPYAVYATNTSSLSVTALAAGSQRPDRVLGMHFFNPAPVMRLVEVVPTVLSDQAVVEAVRGLAVAAGKTPIVVADRAGFVANALLLPYLAHAAHLVETERAGVVELDEAARAALDLPMGPLALTDLIGLDVCVAILDVLWDEFRDRRYAVPPLLRRLAVAGRLGRKSGAGWYDYGGAEPAPAVGGKQPLAPSDLAALVDAHLADAERMVADRYATTEDVDTAMRLGCGYRRGPFEMLAAR